MSGSTSSFFLEALRRLFFRPFTSYSSSISSQTKQSLNEGDQFFLKKDFNSAIHKYKDCLIQIQYDRRKEQEFTDHQFTKKELKLIVMPVLFQLAQCNYELHKYDLTLLYCREIFKYECTPYHKKAFHLQNIVYVEKGDYTSALKYFERKRRNTRSSSMTSACSDSTKSDNNCNNTTTSSKRYSLRSIHNPIQEH